MNKYISNIVIEDDVMDRWIESKGNGSFTLNATVFDQDTGNESPITITTCQTYTSGDTVSGDNGEFVVSNLSDTTFYLQSVTTTDNSLKKWIGLGYYNYMNLVMCIRELDFLFHFYGKLDKLEQLKLYIYDRGIRSNKGAFPHDIDTIVESKLKLDSDCHTYWNSEDNKGKLTVYVGDSSNSNIIDLVTWFNFYEEFKRDRSINEENIDLDKYADMWIELFLAK